MAPNYVMIVALITFICFSLSFGDDAMLPTSHNNLIAKPNCNESCGNISIPFPFGMTPDCILRDQFLVTCDYSLNPPQPFLKNSSIEIKSISLAGQLNVLKLISRDCYRDGIRTNRNKPIISLPSLLTVNNTVNRFIAVGCDTYAIVQGYYTKFGAKIEYPSYITGCMSMCKSIDDAVNGNKNSCSGVGCCQTSIPKGAWNVTITLSSYYNYNYTNMTNNPSCSYAFVVDQANFNFSKSYLSSLQNTKKLPLVLDWAVGEDKCKIAKTNSTAYACKSNNSYCHDDSNGYRCSCMQGYDGNPYLIDGCQDINECVDPQPDYMCVKNAICNNTDGNYTCTCRPDFSGDGYTECNRDNPQRIIQNIYLIIGITAGVALIVIIVFGWSYTAFQRRKMSMMKKRFFQENGGLVLLQRLKVEERSSNTNTVKIFTAEELEKATNGFDKDRVVGQGGFGTVYKGYLKDNCIVAIKKSKVIDRNQIEQFINEVLVLSQINHRNVVKLLGCCLETEVPLLVYEFISNGTLSEHLHDKLKASTLSLDIRLKVAAETAGVLSYLHSAAYPPIIHRDIKSVNILLDKNYTAKVSDFGASRLVPADQTELSTLVQGTLGYLDPEYLQTSQLTEKSDVYSFGVVLVELLTGRKALCFQKPEEERSLAQYFISSVEKGHLFDILDDNIVCDEGNVGQLKNAAVLAQRCLNIKGDDRPIMKEVAAELEAGSRLKHSWAQIDQHSEEIESLLHDTQPLGFGYEYSEQSVHIDSITSHVTLPFPGGR
ncbi:wall-associated receptor kinase 2-like [Solanum stenotomum]|uniref:wall-associated receptor kinase 2-like n=1 Tax=Solanum stenotomum TaxID=172797 RepID=UPI0020D017BE|nr:wall-associated receptor kinase 2-like [Solanum stenotomum]